MNNKTVYVLPKRSQFIFVPADLKIVEADFYWPSPFRKRDILKLKFIGQFFNGSLIRTFCKNVVHSCKECDFYFIY
jgi:hypothetical protein